MAQGPIATFSQYPGGTASSFNITAAKVIKASPGNIRKIIVQVAGTAGSLILNDNNLTGASNVIGNQLLSIAFGSLTVGQVISLDAVCLVGITISAVTTGGVFVCTYQ